MDFGDCLHHSFMSVSYILAFKILAVKKGDNCDESEEWAA